MPMRLSTGRQSSLEKVLSVGLLGRIACICSIGDKVIGCFYLRENPLQPQLIVVDDVIWSSNFSIASVVAGLDRKFDIGRAMERIA